MYDEISASGIYDDNIPELIKEYLRDDEIEDSTVTAYWQRAVHYIESYTGCEREELKDKSEVVHALLAIVTDMHDNRQHQGERSYINQLTASILDMYRRNFV